jgi:hypothetical protein
MVPMSTRRFDDPNTQVVADILSVIERGLPGLPPGPVADSLSKLAPMLEAAIERRTLEQAKEELERIEDSDAAAAACRRWLRTDAPPDGAGQ